jgi:signal peptidase II
MRATETANTPAQAAYSPWRRRLLFLGAAALVVALDQATKEIVRSSLARGEIWPSDDWPVRIRHVTNTGAAFGILQDQTAFLVLMTFIGLAAIYLYYRNPPFEHAVAPLATGMMLGGAIGNLADRVRLGRVTDFIDFPHWPAFNIADSSISIGVAIIIIGSLLFAQKTVGAHSGEDASPEG